MAKVMHVAASAVTVLTLLLINQSAAADEPVAVKAAAPVVSEAAKATVPVARTFLGAKALDASVLQRKRAGTDVFNDAQLRGVVANNSAVNVSTGANVISDGAFAGQSGIPLVVQNSGNNVLIQNATIINLQVK